MFYFVFWFPMWLVLIVRLPVLAALSDSCIAEVICVNWHLGLAWHLMLLQQMWVASWQYIVLGS